MLLRQDKLQVANHDVLIFVDEDSFQVVGHVGVGPESRPALLQIIHLVQVLCAHHVVHLVVDLIVFAEHFENLADNHGLRRQARIEQHLDALRPGEAPNNLMGFCVVDEVVED